MNESALVCYDVTDAMRSHPGPVPESPTLFNSSPFKVLSPQPPKFLKSLLTVREESKAKKVLEARPLLGQEVTSDRVKSPREDFILTLWPDVTILCSFCPRQLLFLNVSTFSVLNCIAVCF